MTLRSSRVESGVLYLAGQESERSIELGSVEWFAWLMEPTTSSFVVRTAPGNLTVRKERRQRGGDYWTAYRRVDKRLRKAYLGKSLQLTPARLERAARLLAAQQAGSNSHPVDPEPASTSAAGPQSPLVATRLVPPPPPPDRIHRARLTGWLTAQRSCPVLLVTAPAGFGKTTLLADWMTTPAMRDLPFAWVTLDAADNDPAQFWSYLIAALRTVLPDLPLDTISLLRSPRLASPRLVAAALVNAVASVQRDITLILDDYHIITAQPVHDGLTFLFDHMPVSMRVILAARAEPPLPLSRLRARGRLACLDAADLRCTPRETAAFLRRGMGLRLPPEAETALAERTEGWFAALRLAALALCDHDDNSKTLSTLLADSRFVASFLHDEVIQRQPPAVQRFLLDTSPLDELTGPLCDALTGERNGEATLRHLAAANLFLVPLDESGRTYRYHQLFASVLRDRLRHLHPDREAALFRRASEWYALNGRCAEAIRYALAAGDSERAANLLNDAAFSLIWERGEIAMIHGWLAALPEELLAVRPTLAVAYAYTSLLTHADADAERWIAALAHLPPHSDDAHLLRGVIVFIQVHLALRRGDLTGSVALAREALAREALQHLPPSACAACAQVTLALGMAHYHSGDPHAATRSFAAALRLSQNAHNLFLTSLALSHLSAITLDTADLRQAAQWCREAIRLARDNPPSAPSTPPAPYAGPAYHLMAEVLYEWNELDNALHHAEEAARLLPRMGDTSHLLFLHELLIRLHVARGNHVAARAAFDALRAIRHPNPDDDTWQAVFEVRWRLLEGDVSGAALWTPTFYPRPAAAPEASAPNNVLVEFELVTLARLRLTQGRYDDVQEVVANALPPAERAGKTARVAELRALEALAWYCKGDPARGLDSLKCALELAQPGCYVRLFVDLGEPMAALLRRAHAHGIAPGYVRHLLAAFQAPRHGAALTPQELRILQLIAAGSPNAAVAQQLLVSTSTVKSHLYHIYQKLGARNRAHALALAHDSGILTSAQ